VSSLHSCPRLAAWKEGDERVDEQQQQQQEERERERKRERER
jgi:hypothetical protein